uniref:Uncharacterized protein n=1 Tax=Anguilla anguilla TaxID=7936 RepID=A0A0E9XFB7_ANGAN
MRKYKGMKGCSHSNCPQSHRSQQLIHSNEDLQIFPPYSCFWVIIIIISRRTKTIRKQLYNKEKQNLSKESEHSLNVE